MKKLAALFVVLVMAFSLFACAGGGTATQQAGTGPATTAAEPAAAGLSPYVIDYLMLTNSVSTEIPAVTAEINRIIQPKFNATLNLTMLDWGSWFTVVNTMLNAGEKADIMFTADWWQFAEGIANNYFTPLNDLLATYAPQVVSQLGPAFINGSQVNGINYGVPTDKELAVNGGFMWNKALADKHGLVPNPNWKSYRDWEPFLEIIKENEPSHIVPLLTDGATYHLNTISYISCDIGWNANNPNDPTLFWMWEAPFYTNELHVMRDLYQKGYIPRDAVTGDNDWYNNYLTTGNFFVVNQPLKPGKGKSTELMSAALPGVEYDEFETYPLLVNTTHCGGSMLAIPSTSQDPARAMMFINEMHTNPELNNLLAWGVEGLTYEVVQTSPVKLVRAIDGNSWTGAVLTWTLGNFFSIYLADHEPLDKYELLAATKVGIPGHVANGYRFDPANWLDTITACNNAMEEFARPLRVGAIDTDEGLANLISAAENAGFRAYFDAVKADLQAWLDAR
jgi:putative aldouronate transport system substrate-binding protein